MKVYTQSFVNRSALKKEFWQLHTNKTFPIDDSDVMENQVDWGKFYLNGVIEINCNGVEILGKDSSDLLPEGWALIGNLMEDVIDNGVGRRTADDQGFCLGMELKPNRIVEFTNYGGVNKDGVSIIEPMHVLVPAKDLFSALIDGYKKFLSLYVRHNKEAQHLLVGLARLEKKIFSWLDTAESF